MPEEGWNIPLVKFGAFTFWAAAEEQSLWRETHISTAAFPTSPYTIFKFILFSVHSFLYYNSPWALSLLRGWWRTWFQIAKTILKRKKSWRLHKDFVILKVTTKLVQTIVIKTVFIKYLLTFQLKSTLIIFKIKSYNIYIYIYVFVTWELKTLFCC